MPYKTEVENLIKNLHRVAEKRQEFAGYLRETSKIIESAEGEGANKSGQLFLEREIQDLQITGENLQTGRFRLMVLGDMKHGKSTLLNVLLGKQLLPSAVNPCTAILTIIRYGKQERVTVYFQNGSEQTMSFEQFSREFTIDPKEAKRFEESQVQAFPDVKYAVVEYDLDLLENGVEIVDTPGLNDTDERNQLTLGYINSCHAILFVLNATKPCTMEERRYLENYLNGRGLTIFFLINRWDELQKSAFDPDDEIEVRKYEEAQRQVFASNLQEYTIIEGDDLYHDRVFETSALNALRRRVKNQKMDGTGIPEFLGSLQHFLTTERAISEFRQARALMRQTYNRVYEATERRIPMLGQDVNELKQRIKSVEPEFRKLRDIRDQFTQEINKAKDRRSDAIAESAFTYISNLDQTFEADFKPYLPDLNIFNMLWKGKQKQQEFQETMKTRFQKYVSDRMSNWNRTAELELKDAFSQLAISAAQYGSSYANITDSINSKLIGVDVSVGTGSLSSAEDKSPAWSRFAVGAAAFLMGNPFGAAGAALGVMSWKTILRDVAILVGVNAVLIGVFNVALTPIGAAIAMALSGGTQLEILRREFIKKTKISMKEQLPNVAREQAKVIYREVKQLFEQFNDEVSSRMEEDFQSRQSELDKLVEQRETGEFEFEQEVTRLKKLQMSVHSQWQAVEVAYDDLMGQKV